jgi:hypothetical protein
MKRDRSTDPSRSRRSESGSALFVAVMMLVLMGALGIVALDKVTIDRQVAGFQNRAQSAFFAAEAGVAEARDLVAEVGTRSQVPNFHTVTAPRVLGDTALYDVEGSTPRYYGDPRFAPDFIRYKGDGGAASGMNLQWGKQKLVTTLWQINVVGQTPDGSRSRQEVVEVKILSQGY